MSTRLHATAARGYPADFVAQLLDNVLARDATANDIRIHGISGLQGVGRSTLVAQMAALAAQRGKTVAVLSIDDFYLDLDARTSLARRVHPLLATRGPPGTHDVALACRTLDALRDGRDIRLPRFDKISDRRQAMDDWPQVGSIDLVLLEGWFLGTPAQPANALLAPINALERDEDRDGTWRRYCNEALARDYPALWQRIDHLLLLQGPDFDVVPGWRWQQEQSLQAANPGRQAMTRVQVERFVQFFERTSRQALRTLPGIADQIVHLDAARQPLTDATNDLL